MRTLYSILTHISFGFLWISRFFSKKMQLFMKGRVHVLENISNAIKPDDKTIWFHCASLGEYEQGLPIMEGIKSRYPEYKIVLTFFSPSGYEIKKDSPVADVVCYLPLDTVKNAKRFVKIVHPALAIFVKYEFWPNYLFELEKLNIPSLLVSGLFRKKQSFFKPHGVFMRRALRTIDYFFVQNESSESLLRSIGIENVKISGDTRFDRVSQQIEQDNSLPYLDTFKGDSVCIVCGSTWPEDENILLPFINESGSNVKFIIAPHIIDPGKIESFRKKISKSSLLFSERDSENLLQASVFIVDTIGLLTRIYSYADIAYVGGAMGNSGLHNILEPATFGVPIVIGKNFKKFPEALRLQSLAALFSASTSEEISDIMNKLVSDKNFRTQTGMIAGHFVNSNTGATSIIMNHIESLHSDGLI
ncbi:MAG: 3-deoxy-D-manno-octulosonic acid transferase [Bacteroidia bacterium]|nr:3-deoxy-D-manno-octulosonic acid transferase [Bacteroidia bacterium]NNF29838.1 3-deoxy-D-manno-octulosonic acid transferase [Flavobacteriaceae bacterium]MBT8275962.1 3-deoxy-D-manno-octulosonic acid transferase [Bacteroidia bacterium]NNJ82992.1 3-deoxy-D-manno-octulosonic acid transferase [Flavobacteriaceae bacterium]NNK53802.1 3-deoxy-D-manno-octulosonic acid transferase [Flavobacteriaceae bacterium]